MSAETAGRAQTNPPTLTEARCAACRKRLLDYVNGIVDGRVVIRKRCRHCRHMNELTVYREALR